MAGSSSRIINLQGEDPALEKVVRDAEPVPTGMILFRPHYHYKDHRIYSQRIRRTDSISDSLRDCEGDDILQLRLWGEDDEFGLRIPCIDKHGMKKTIDFEFYEAHVHVKHLQPPLEFLARRIQNSTYYLVAHGYNKKDGHWNVLLENKHKRRILIRAKGMLAEEVKTDS